MPCSGVGSNRIHTRLRPNDSTLGLYDHTTGLWDVGNLAATASETLTIVVTVDPDTTGSLANTASASGNEIDPDDLNNSSTAFTDVSTSADLGIIKGDDPDPVTAGGTLTYTLDYTNNGPSDKRVSTSPIRWIQKQHLAVW